MNNGKKPGPGEPTDGRPGERKRSFPKGSLNRTWWTLSGYPATRARSGEKGGTSSRFGERGKNKPLGGMGVGPDRTSREKKGGCGVICQLVL